jgi:hypothetical protein
LSIGEQLECPDCGRKFNPIPYEKHIKICAKVFLQKRQAFDSKKHRMNEELEKLEREKKQAEKYNKKKGKAAQAERETTGEKSSKWKEQSKQFREAMRAARVAAQAEANGEAPPAFVPSAPDPSLIPCPNCGRHFNERAAERHLPLCKNIKAQPKSLKRGSGGAGGKAGTAVVMGTKSGAGIGGAGGTGGPPQQKGKAPAGRR